MAKEFKPDKKYVYTGKYKGKRPHYFNQDGMMDFLLDGKPHLVTKVTERDENLTIQSVEFSDNAKSWVVEVGDFTEITSLKLSLNFKATGVFQLEREKGVVTFVDEKFPEMFIDIKCNKGLIDKFKKAKEVEMTILIKEF